MERKRADVAAPASPGCAEVEPEAEPEAEPDAVPPQDAAPAREPSVEAAAEPVQEPEAPAPADIADDEQAALWRERQARAWHQRTWLRVLVGLAAVVGLAAIIPYPLRIISECTIIPGERARVRAELQGVLSEILVDEARAVKQGEVIARLDDRALKAERLKMLAEIDKIEAELATLRQGHRREELQQQEAVLAARRNEVEFAAKEADRRDEMAREGVGSRQAAEEASRALETRRRAVDEAQAALRLLQAGTRPEEIAAHEAVLKRARAELAYVDEKLAMTFVRAPVDGEILTPRFREHVHEGVEAGGLVCEIANTRRMRAEILVPERDVDAISLGMPAVVKVESYPTHRFEGKVDFIAPTVDGDDKRVRVVVELDNAARLLKANMSGYGEVETGDHSLLHLATRRVLRWIRVRFLI
jgi:multidrug resistance efflux pump